MVSVTNQKLFYDKYCICNNIINDLRIKPKYVCVFFSPATVAE